MLEGAIDVPRGADMFPKTVVVAALCASYGGQAPIIVPATRRSIHQSTNSKTSVFRLLCGRKLDSAARLWRRRPTPSCCFLPGDL